MLTISSVEKALIMKNASSCALSLFAVTLTLISTPTIAQKVSKTDQAVALNSPDIKVFGKGAIRSSWILGKAPEYNFVLRSSPSDLDAELYLFRTNLQLQRSNKNYEVLTCRTPCLFKIPAGSDFSFNVKTPLGFDKVSKDQPVKWVATNLVGKMDIEPNDVTVYFVQN
jgi:hypothetical protein